AAKPVARGLIVREDITNQSNWRADNHFYQWLINNSLSGISGIDTRALTRRIRDHGAPNAIICHAPDGQFDLPALHAEAAAWPGLEGMDLAKEVSCTAPYEWPVSGKPRHHVVAIDYGIKQNILRCLSASGCRVTVVPCTMPANDILALKPDGVFLSNGPGDPAATGVYAVPVIRDLLKSGKPLFGICLGHQLLALAMGGKTEKMHLGHRGANQPVKYLQTSKVEISSQNHGFCVIPETLPQDTEVTHISLFDNSNEGLRIKGKPVFSVQYHPEASPGPHDSHYLFERFVNYMKGAA
ncbi:MAG TPA: glutamine-hydrolyzing carbamoyl-phosphate synthase small subunit, partial [Alphaproteobacteria bacterium]